MLPGSAGTHLKGMTIVRNPLNQEHARTALVVSGDPSVRADWAQHFEALGMRALRCVGPEVLCALLDGKQCPLHDEADVAIYDRSSVTPELTLKLVRSRPSLPIFFAADQLDAAGRHKPLVTSVLSRERDENRCVGPSVGELVR